MADRRGRKLSFANVVSALALFVALGGTAIAVNVAPKNSVVTRSIKDRAVTQEKVRCPRKTVRAGGTCLERVARASEQNIFLDDQTCAARDRRLPSLAELRAGLLSGAISQQPDVYEWTADIFNRGDQGQNELLTTLAVANGGTQIITVPHNAGLGMTFRCATGP